MDIRKVKKLIELLDESGIAEMLQSLQRDTIPTQSCAIYPEKD